MILNNKGFSLIELLVTLMIVTIGIAAIVKFQGSYFYYSDISKQRAEAVVLAKTKLESLRAFQVLTTTAGMTAYDDIVSGTSTSSANNTTYTTTWTVTAFTNPSYKTVNVAVTWADRRSVAQSISLTSIIGKTDPATSGVLVYS